VVETRSGNEMRGPVMLNYDTHCRQNASTSRHRIQPAHFEGNAILPEEAIKQPY
jgi:hypothetical protein